MSRLETRQAANGGVAQRIRHVGTSLLPLALFVGGALGYEQYARHAATELKHAASMPTQKAGPAPKEIAAIAPGGAAPAGAAASATATAPRAVAVDSTPSAPVATSKLTPTRAIPSLRDERSLLDLAVATSPASVQPAPSSPAAPIAPAPQRVPEARPVDVAPLTLPAAPAPSSAVIEPAGVPRVHPLGLKPLPVAAPGTYAVVRGVPQQVQLSHGIPVGDEAWLVDGGDIERTAVTWRSSTALEPFELDVIVLSSESRVLTRDRIKVGTNDTPASVPAKPSIPAEPARATAALAPTRTAPAASPEKPALAIAPETALVPGRGSLIRLDLEPAGAIPTGAYVVVRGLPEETTLSRGFQMGPDAWMVSITDLKGLEARLPARATGTVTLDVRLLSADGQLLAGDKRTLSSARTSEAPRLAALPATPAPPVGPAAPAAAQPAARGAVIAPPVPILPPPAITRTGPAATPAAATPATPLSAGPIAPAVPAPAPQKAISPEALMFSRGRRMLDAGNIALARPLLERAAATGSGEAANLLASSFDPAWLRRVGVIGIDGDPDSARRWATEAQRLGRAEAAQPARNR